MAATPTPASTPILIETLDLPAAFAESVAMLRTVMRTSDKESARLSAARTLANLAARFIPRPSLHRALHAAVEVPAAPPTSTVATEVTSDAATPSPQPSDPRGQDASTSSTTPTTPPTSARPRSRPRTASSTAASAGAAAPTRPTVTAIPPLTEKLYPEPNEVLDPLFEVLASPIPTSPMTEAELDELQAIHANLKREDLKNPRRAARWRHQLREDRFWKAYWQEYRKNTPAFRAVRKTIMNRKPLPTTPNLPSEPLASASDHTPTPQLDSGPIISSPHHPIIPPHPNTS